MPLPVGVLPVNISQVPPPVTAPDIPPLAGATKVPAPVSLIFKPEGADPEIADANATPPGLTVVVGKLTLTMSQRAWSAPPSAEAGVASVWPRAGSDARAIDPSPAFLRNSRRFIPTAGFFI